MNKKKMAGEAVTKNVKDGMILGLGTGSTAYYAINAIGELVKKGMNLKAVPTSESTKLQARELGIPLLTIDDVDHIDLAIDGVDEIDSHFNAIKGGGGALYREKVVATFAKEVIWIMDDSKLVNSIGRFPLPVEIAKYGSKQAFSKMHDFGFSPVLRVTNGEKFITDNGNYIVDLHLGAPINIDDVITKLSSIVGVLEHGLFINMCKYIVVGTDEGVKIIKNNVGF